MAEAKLRIAPPRAWAFTLGRQGLIDHQLRPLDVVRRLVAVQSQYSASVPVAVWSRQGDTPPGWVDDALLKNKTLVRVWTLRGTVHTLASRDLPLLTGLRLESHDYWLGLYLKSHGVTAGQLERRNRKILAALEDGPLTRAELHERVPELKGMRGAGYGLDVRPLAFTGEVVFAGQKGGQPRFARRELWLPRLKWDPPGALKAGCELLRRYYAAYGPASRQDFAYWSGLKSAQARPLFAACADELAEVEVDGWPSGQLVLRRDLRELARSDAELPAVSLLPKFDNLLLAWRDKGRVVDPAGYKLVYRKAAQVEAVVLLSGRVAATWRASGKRILKVELEPARRLAKAEMKLIEGEFDRYAHWQGCSGAAVAVR